MNRQYSYNNFDYKYMHKGHLLLLLYIFLCGWVIDILQIPQFSCDFLDIRNLIC